MRRQAMLLLMLFFCIFLASCSNNSFKEGSEPDGFRNIKWGTNLRLLENMKHIGNRDDFGEVIALYIRMDDELIVGGAALEKIEYSFWNNKFFEVSLGTGGYRKCAALKESAIERFGKGKNEKNKIIEWIGDKSIATFQGFISGRCNLSIWSYDIYKELINQSRQKSSNKAKEGAGKGL